MSAQLTPGPWYEFRAARCYAEGERYSTGSGLSVSTQNLSEAEGLFAGYQSGHCGEVYCLTVRRCDTDETLMHSGPSPKDAKRSMLRAYRERFSRANHADRAAIAKATGSAA
jgi:hypothetical protein